MNWKPVVVLSVFLPASFCQELPGVPPVVLIAQAEALRTLAQSSQDAGASFSLSTLDESLASDPLLAESLIEPLEGGGIAPEEPRFHWNAAVKQSTLFLAIQHSFRLLTEPGTRAELKGPFFKDWFKSIRGYSGWDDGDPFIVNYVGHPMMGSVSGYIQIQNDLDGRSLTISRSREYWHSRLRAFTWAAVYSAAFEIGPISETSIGNVGKDPHYAGVVDFVVTPVVGLGWLLAEDTLDRYLVAPIERRTDNRVLKAIVRGVLNPSRTFANTLAGNSPWARWDRGGIWNTNRVGAP